MVNYYEQIKEKLIDNEINEKVKDFSKERYKVTAYFETGRLLCEAGGKYGDKIIDEYSKKLIVEVGKKYNRSYLFRMKQLYNLFSNKNVAPLVRQLSWSHCLLILPIKDINEINYYVNQVLLRNLSKRQLKDIINNKEYNRLPTTSKNKVFNQKKLNIQDFIKNPIIINNSNKKEVYSEKTLQKIILDNIRYFMKELGEGYSFIDNEYKIKIGDRYNYIDLLLFNMEFNCYVVVELKTTELKKEHVGQIEIYMNYIDKNIKKDHHSKTIGIIVCKKNNRYVIEYSSDKRIISREYIVI